MHYQHENPGDWGQMTAGPGVATAIETWTAADNCEMFVRSWKTAGPAVLLILHGLGGHSGWYIDMGNELAVQGMSVYMMEHRGFGRSAGMRGHITAYNTFVDDIAHIIKEIRRRHPHAALFLLGHSMGGIFTAHVAAREQEGLAGVIFLNPWVRDTSNVALGTTLSVLFGGIFKSQRYWQFAGGPEGMTANPEAIQMLAADPYWQRSQTSSFLFQILLMRSAMLKQAQRITLAALVLQAEADRAVLPEASHAFFQTLASRDKTWKTYPKYAHDTQFEADRSVLDTDIANWIREHTPVR